MQLTISLSFSSIFLFSHSPYSRTFSIFHNTFHIFLFSLADILNSAHCREWQRGREGKNEIRQQFFFYFYYKQPENGLRLCGDLSSVDIRCFTDVVSEWRLEETFCCCFFLRCLEIEFFYHIEYILAYTLR